MVPKKTIFLDLGQKSHLWLEIPLRSQKGWRSLGARHGKTPCCRSRSDPFISTARIWSSPSCWSLQTGRFDFFADFWADFFFKVKMNSSHIVELVIVILFFLLVVGAGCFFFGRYYRYVVLNVILEHVCWVKSGHWCVFCKKKSVLALCIRTLKVFNLGKDENSFRRNWELHSSHNAGSWKGLLGGGFK